MTYNYEHIKFALYCTCYASNQSSLTNLCEKSTHGFGVTNLIFDKK